MEAIPVTELIDFEGKYVEVGDEILYTKSQSGTLHRGVIKAAKQIVYPENSWHAQKGTRHSMVEVLGHGNKRTGWTSHDRIAKV